MVREIKFRVWETKEKRMLQSGSFDIHLSCNSYGISYKFINDQERQYRFVSCKRNNFNKDKPEVILLQYTGLKDKKGKEIYERDIVRVWDEKIGRIVEWDADRWSCDGLSLINTCEVIGNIYENPELIKQNGNVQ